MGRSLILLFIYALLLAVATFIEKYAGTTAARAIIYYSPVLILLQAVIVGSFIAGIIKHRLLGQRKWSFLIIHGALIIILLGALITHICGEEGVIHIREGQNASRMLVRTNKGDSYKNLPFNIQLKEFILTCYPGSSSPASFESILIIHEDGKFTEKTISVNKTLDIKGYRLFQSSYDTDEKGTILSVNKDIPGRQISYTGYFLLITGFVLFLTSKKSRLRTLIRSLKELRILTPSLIFLMVLIPLMPLKAQPPPAIKFLQENKIPPDHARKFGSLAFQSPDGRIKPVNTFSSEILRKLYKSDNIWGMNSDQFLLSVVTFPERWMHIPFIQNNYSYIEFFDTEGNYKLQHKIEEIYHKSPSERNKSEKNLLKLDEKIHLFHQLLNLNMLNFFPDKDDLLTLYLNSIRIGLETCDWEKADEILNRIYIYQLENDTNNAIHKKKIKAELLYNKLNIFRSCKMIYLIFGIILLWVHGTRYTVHRTHSKPRTAYRVPCTLLLNLFILSSFLYHIFGMGLRWYIAGYAPWSNSYETMLLASLISVLAGIIFYRQSKIVYALAILFGGVILFVSGLNWMDPQISSLVPVLNSPWLMFHVAVIMISYGFFGISFLLGLINLVLLKVNKKKENEIISLKIKELSIINEISLWVGLSFLTTGTFLGAIWANESWGRYWGWDPKETWALITIIAYAIVTHISFVNKKDNPNLLNAGSVIAFFCVLMTYIGVNYFLSGMHSYG